MSRGGKIALIAITLGVLSAATSGVASAAGRCGDPGARPWCDTSRTPAERTSLLLAAMTLDEKLSLMAGDDLGGVFTGNPATGTSNGVDRLGIPVLYHSDGPIGPREGQATAMPGPLALASTFDPPVAGRVGATIADEVKHKGNDLVHAPTVEPMRTPLAGRTFEGYGEDPLLASRLAVEWIRAAQNEGIIGNVKHFAPNSQEGRQGAPPLTGGEGSRFFADAIIDERTLREIYFPAFEAAVKQADAGAVMCAYGALNGDFACESEYLLQRVLRQDWAFDGFVIADYGFAMKSTANSANAGTDLEMPIPFWYAPPNLQTALAAGQITEQTIDARVGAILRTMFRFGLFDRDAYVADDNLIDKPAHAAVARELEEQGTVLLENRDGALPLDPDTLDSIAVIGAEATAYKTGGGSSKVNPFEFKNPLDAITQRAGSGVEVRHDPGSDPAAAAAAATGADAAIVFVADVATEGSDKPCLALRCAAVDPAGGTGGTETRPDPDLLVDAVEAANPRTIIVMETGGPVLTPWRDRVEALVEAWYPGQEAGPAIARVLFGDVDPGGRLPVSFPVNEADIPAAGNPAQYPGVGTRVEHSEGVLIGYRHYDERGIEPAYPFGFGLSYTTTEMSDLHVNPTTDGAEVSVRVTNTGDRRGWAVPQLYVGLPKPSPDIVMPRSQLRGFDKLSLAPGESQTVTFALGERDFSYWDTSAQDWSVASGCATIKVGSSSRDLPLQAPLAIGGGSCGYPRPKGASPLYASLVPAYQPCGAPNRTHGPPLSFGSCSPPTQTSDELTVGSFDSNGKPTRSISPMRFQTLPGPPPNPPDEADVLLEANITDVYTQGTLADYAGELRAETTLRITDKLNTPHPGGPGAGTVQDIPFGFTIPCAITSDPDTGGACTLNTTANALYPGAIVEGRRAIWQLGQLEVYDGGADDDGDTAADNTLFMKQGVFVP
jgi:beta-glucosidase